MYFRSLIVWVWLLLPGVLSGADDDGTLVIGTKIAPPFVMMGAQGELDGLSIQLWHEILKDSELGIEIPSYRFEVTDLNGLITGVSEGRYDAGIAAITASFEREALFDLSHPYVESGLAIAVPAQKESTFGSLLGGLTSWSFLATLATLAGMLAIPGIFMWLAERHRNKEHFGGTPLQGFGNGVWWSAVTMSTVGYGDLVPKSPIGRAVGVIWIFLSLVLVSSVTASLTNAIRSADSSGAIKNIDDLREAKVAVVANSTSETIANGRVKQALVQPTLAEAIALVKQGKADAVIYDEPLLRFAVRETTELNVLPGTYLRQDYAIALPHGSELRRPINRVILHLLDTGKLRTLIVRHLGG